LRAGIPKNIYFAALNWGWPGFICTGSCFIRSDHSPRWSSVTTREEKLQCLVYRVKPRHHSHEWLKKNYNRYCRNHTSAVDAKGKNYV
jgi:hypothetical protein